jgi:hypothetical protein
VDWRTRPHDEIMTLRVCKNVLAPMKVIGDRLMEGAVAAQIDHWLKLWPRLP